MIRRWRGFRKSGPEHRRRFSDRRQSRRRCWAVSALYPAGRLIFAENGAQGIADFADSDIAFDGFDKEGHERVRRRCAPPVRFFAEWRPPSPDRGQRAGLRARRSAGPGRARQRARSLRGEQFPTLIAVDADDGLRAALDVAQRGIGGILDFPLDEAVGHCLEGASHPVDTFNVLAGLALDFVGQTFDVVAAAKRVHDIGDAAFSCEDLLGAEGDLDCLFGGQGKGLVL